MICGTPAANIAKVPKFLEYRTEDNRWRPLEHRGDSNAALVRDVNRLRPERDTYVCLVDEHDVWTKLWIEGVADALRTTQRGRNLRVVFRADPDHLWRFMEDLPDEYLPDRYRLDGNELFDWMPAQPWNAAFLRRWCSDQGLHEASSKIEDLLELTGGWPLLLERYAESEEKTWRGRASELDRYIKEHVDDLLAAVGLGDLAARRDLAPLRAWGEPLNADDVGTYAAIWEEEGRTPVTADVLRRRLYWATQLGLLQDVDGSTVFNPLVARILPDATQ